MDLRSIADLRNTHEGETFVVCGCGPSIELMVQPSHYRTIGVNDVPRWFSPDYLLIVDSPRQIGDERWTFVEKFEGPLLGPSVKPPRPRLRCSAWYAYTHKISQHPLSIGKELHTSNNTPFIACMAALYMGAKRVGLLGVDITEGHGLRSTLGRIAQDYARLGEFCRGKGIPLEMLSDRSAIKVLPQGRFEDYENR